MKTKPTVLITWELGGGLGHLMPLLPIAEGFVKRGAKVFIAYKDLSKVTAIYGQAGVNFLQAPIRIKSKPFFLPDITFAHILANVGFGDEGELFGLACAWRNLIGLVHPDLVIFDYSPTALLASRGFPLRRAIVGFGFCTPPDASPLPIVNPARAAKANPARLLQAENDILVRINNVLGAWKQPPISRVSQLFADVDENILSTFPVIDHFGPRPGAKYWGPLGSEGGGKPQWPKGSSCKKIYAYLKPGRYLSDVLKTLIELGHSTIVFSHEFPHAMGKNFQAPNICYEDNRLDPKLVALEADCAVLNATHGTSLDFLLAGKPIVQLPLTLEQSLITQKTLLTGAVIAPDMSKELSKNLSESISTIFSDGSYRKNAESIAEKYRDFDRNTQLKLMLDRLYDLIEPRN